MPETDSKDFRPRILKALNLQGRLTGRQIAKALYPQEFISDEVKTYQRIMKNLKTLEGEGLLASDSYGLGVEKLWRISTKGKDNKKLISDLGYKETGKLNKMFYEHELSHGWAFLAFLLSGELRGYKRNSNNFLKDDAWLEFGSVQYYLEIEMGNHSADRIEEKISRYRKHYHETKQPLHVLFVEGTEAKVEERIATFDRLQLTQHYQVALLSELVENIFTARISSRQDTSTFAEKLSV